MLRPRAFSQLLAVAMLALAMPAAAQQPAIYDDRDRVHPVFATHGMVATQEANATRIGLEVLQSGGNAVDAAVTVAFALAVTLPQAGNLGGGGFMLVHDAARDETVAIDYREMSGAAASRDMFLDATGAADPEKSRYSGLAVGVPGTLAGMALALERYGTLSLAEALAPAIELAAGGIVVSAELSDSLKAASERLQILSDTDGVARCHTVYNCTDACPRGIHVTKAIGELKLAMVTGKLD